MRLAPAPTGEQSESFRADIYSSKYQTTPATTFRKVIDSIMSSVNRNRPHRAYSRSERERSHYSEWEQDIIAWIIENGGADGAFVCTKQQQLSDELGIARSSLNELF